MKGDPNEFTAIDDPVLPSGLRSRTSEMDQYFGADSLRTEGDLFPDFASGNFSFT